MAIITAAQYKTFKGISVTTYDAQLAVVIPAAQSDAERFCGRLFDTATYTETFSGDGSGFYLLKNAPITSITSLSYLTRNADGTETATALSVQSYRFDADTGELYLVPRGRAWGTFSDQLGAPYVSGNFTSPSFSSNFGNYRVVYVGGYSSMPADLQLAMYQYVDHLMALALASPGSPSNLTGETLGDYSYSRKADSESLGSSSILQRLFGKFRRATL